MKYWTLTLLAIMILCVACEDEGVGEPTLETSYIQDNIFDCNQFEVMEIEEKFSVNVESNLEVFNRFFVYAGNENLVIKDGFNGPTLQSTGLAVEDLIVFNNQLMICAEEGLYSLNASGEISTITTNRCYSMALDGQGRLILQGVFGNPQLGSSYNIHEYKNNTIAPFASYPSSFECVSIDLVGGSGQSLYAISCDNEIAYYKNGVINAEFDNGEAPLFTTLSWRLLNEFYDDGLIAIVQGISSTYRMYKLVGETWEPIYDLAYENRGTEKNREVFVYVDYNMLINNDYLYTFRVGGAPDVEGISRFDISGNEQKSWEDIELIQIPGIDSRDIIDIVIASDGHAYAVLNSKKIVRISC